MIAAAFAALPERITMCRVDRFASASSNEVGAHQSQEDWFGIRKLSKKWLS